MRVFDLPRGVSGEALIRNLVEGDIPERIGLDFIAPEYSDMVTVKTQEKLVAPRLSPEYYAWGRHQILSEKIGFRAGEVKLDPFNNIWLRVDKGYGRCFLGSLSTWDRLDEYFSFAPDVRFYQALVQQLQGSKKYHLAHLPINLFTQLKDARGYETVFVDILLEPGMVRKYLARAVDIDVEACVQLKEAGVHGILVADDWGMQDRTLISPKHFRKLFLPAYAELFQAAHALDMDVFLHSCGNIKALIPSFLEIGVDVFQFNQQVLYPLDWLVENFGTRVAFHLSIDIQKMLPTGDKQRVEDYAKYMLRIFKQRRAALIARDYDSMGNLQIDPELAQYGRTVFLTNPWYANL